MRIPDEIPGLRETLTSTATMWHACSSAKNESPVQGMEGGL